MEEEKCGAVEGAPERHTVPFTQHPSNNASFDDGDGGNIYHVLDF